MATAEIANRDAEREILKDIGVLAVFIGAYCKVNHGDAARRKFESVRYFIDGGPSLCDECRSLIGYAIGKHMACPYDPKPTCRKCPTHCYRNEYRDKWREIMRFSGPYLIKRGRLDLLLHYMK